jgi:hypothetical protein
LHLADGEDDDDGDGDGADRYISVCHYVVWAIILNFQCEFSICMFSAKLMALFHFAFNSRHVQSLSIMMDSKDINTTTKKT